MIQPIHNFATGIQASSGYTNYRNISASEIINFDVDEYGRLKMRRGSVHMNSTVLPATPKSIFRAYYQTTGLTNKEHLIAACANAAGLHYWNGTNFAELENSSNDPADSVSLSSNARLGYATFLGRCFLGNGTSNPPIRSFWIDISDTTPVLYQHGIHDGPPDAPSAAAAAGGSLSASKDYGYAVTFYRHGEDIESLPSSRATVVTTAANKTVNLTNIDVSSDEQTTRRRIYRTSAQDNATLAGSATLHLIATINDNTTTTYSDTGDAVGAAIDCTDHDEPPQWAYVTQHNGRLWLADNDDSYVYFSKMDSLANPRPDTFPVSNVGTDLMPYKFAIGQDDGDIVTAIVPAPFGRHLVVFKRNSHFLVYGNDAATLDAGTQVSGSGCSAPWSIAQVGRSFVYYLANDGKIWRSNGSDAQPVSLPVQPLLDLIPRARYDQVMGVDYQNKYLLAYPTGANENDRVLVFDTARNYWTSYNLALNWLSWWQGEETTDADKNRLVAALSGSAYVDYLFTDASGDDLTDDNSSDITASWQSNWFIMPNNATLTGVKIYDMSGGAYTVRVDYVNESGVNTGTSHTGFQPAGNNNYRQGVFERGRAFQVFFSTTTASAIVERVEIEYELR